MSQENYILETRNLDIGYKSKIVSNNLNLGVQRGELVCLLGTNGSGKSTLLRTLTGLQDSLKGSVLINGRPINSYSAFDLAKLISIVLTERFAGNLKVHELVALGRIPHTGWFGYLSEVDKNIVSESLRKVGISDFSERRVDELSDGERQRVMIAKALAQETPVMLLDEPTAHLDLPNRIAILCLLRTLAQETGKAIIISMHELDMALQISDTIWLMRNQKGIVQGSPEDMVLNGVLEDTFINEKVDFDTASGVFRMVHPINKEISLEGEGLAYLWTEKALRKVGYRITDNPDCGKKVKIIFPEKNVWEININGLVKEVKSIKELMQELKNR